MAKGISIYEATVGDLPTIQKLAKLIWPRVYQTVISEAQINYMLNLFYSESTLMDNFLHKNHRFFIIRDEEQEVGFTSFEHNYQGTKVTRLHKLYLNPEKHGLGLGYQLLHAVRTESELNYSSSISLNVNKYNPAITFYKKTGFQIIGEEKLPIGQDFFMDDYKMELTLTW